MQSRYSIVPVEFFTNVVCIALTCSEKYKYDVRHDLHTVVHVVSEAVTGFSIKKVFAVIKISSKLTRICGIDLVSLNKKSLNF